MSTMCVCVREREREWGKKGELNITHRNESMHK